MDKLQKERSPRCGVLTIVWSVSCGTAPMDSQRDARPVGGVVGARALHVGRRLASEQEGVRAGRRRLWGAFGGPALGKSRTATPRRDRREAACRGCANAGDLADARACAGAKATQPHARLRCALLVPLLSTSTRSRACARACAALLQRCAIGRVLGRAVASPPPPQRTPSELRRRLPGRGSSAFGELSPRSATGVGNTGPQSEGCRLISGRQWPHHARSWTNRVRSGPELGKVASGPQANRRRMATD